TEVEFRHVLLQSSSECLHDERQGTRGTFADFVARGHTLEVIRRGLGRWAELDLAEHVSPGHAVARLLQEPEARGGVDPVVLSRTTTSDLDREHAQLPGLHAGHDAGGCRRHLAASHRLSEPPGIAAHARVAALGLDGAREAFERLAARDRGLEHTPRGSL